MKEPDVIGNSLPSLDDLQFFRGFIRRTKNIVAFLDLRVVQKF